MSQPIDNAELRRLVSLLCEHQLTAPDRARLESMLGDDLAARQFYYDMIILHGELAWENVAARASEVLRQLDSDKQPQPAERARNKGNGGSFGDRVEESQGQRVEKEGAFAPTPRSKSWLNRASRHPLVPSLAVAVALFAALFVGMALTPMGQWIAGGGGGNDKNDLKPAKKTEHVAILNHWHNAVWLDDTRPPLKDPRLKVGRRLKLASGLIEIKYYTGARVVIEGPAEFVVGGQRTEDREQRTDNSRGSTSREQEANSGYLALGKLVARVEGKKADGFTIETPTGRVEDHGTEFGVEVWKGGASEFLVLAGKVDVIREASPGVEAERITLTKDQGAFVANRGARITKRKKADSRVLARHRKLLNTNLSSSDSQLLANGNFDTDGALAGYSASITGWTRAAGNGGFQSGSPEGAPASPTSGPNVALVNAGTSTFPGTEFRSQALSETLEPGAIHTVTFDVAVRDQNQFGSAQSLMANLETYDLNVELVGSADGVLASVDVVPLITGAGRWFRGSLVWDGTEATAEQKITIVLRAANTGEKNLQFVVDSVKLTAKQEVLPEPDSGGEGDSEGLIEDNQETVDNETVDRS